MRGEKKFSRTYFFTPNDDGGLRLFVDQEWGPIPGSPSGGDGNTGLDIMCTQSQLAREGICLLCVLPRLQGATLLGCTAGRVCRVQHFVLGFHPKSKLKLFFLCVSRPECQ